MNTKRKWAIDAALRAELSPDALTADEQIEFSAHFLTAMEKPTPKEEAFFANLRKAPESSRS